jgi:hypothetical protein
LSFSNVGRIGAMGRLTVDGPTLEGLLRGAGWPCDRITPDTWRSHFRGRRGSFPFYVRIDPAGYITFAIVPFLRAPADPAAAERLYERLLVLNQELIMAKFSIDDDLDVVLSVEYPTEELDRSEWDDALDALSFYADRHYDELRRL